MPSRSSRLPHVLRVGLLLGTLLLTLVPATAAQASVAAPGGLSPAGGEVSGVPLFAWQPVRGASAYEIQIEDTVTSRTLVSTTTVNRHYSPTRKLPEAVTWKVRALVGRDAKSAWRSAEITVRKAAAPALLSPRDGATLPQPEEPPLLQWEPLLGAVGYNVDISRDEHFSTSTTYETKSTALVVPDPAAGGTYYWRVTADLGDGLLSHASDGRSYEIGELRPVTAVAPGDGADVEDVVLEWKPTPGAVTYEVWVSSDPDFNDTTATVAKVTGIKGTRYSPPTTFLNDQYYWKVRAVNARRETIDWTDEGRVVRHTFRRHWPHRPLLVHPADSTRPIGDPLYFQWEPIPHASRYQVDVGTDPNFSPKTFGTCETAATTYTPGWFLPNRTADRCMPEQGGVYYWRVRGLDRTETPTRVYGLFSEVRRFVYDSGIVTQVRPEHGAEVAVPALEWLPSQDAETYLVQVTDANGRVTREETHATSWTPALRAANGPFTWTVQARDANNKLSPAYPGRRFTLGGEVPASGAEPLAPLTGTTADPPTTRFPRLSWEPLPAAASYKVSIGDHDSGYFYPPTYTPFLDEKLTFPSGTDSDSKFLSPGSYDWKVTAYDATGAMLATGPVDTFTIADLDTVGGQRLALTGSGLDQDPACQAFLDNKGGPDSCTGVPSTPVLAWDPVPWAAFYMVYVARDRELTNLVYPMNRIPQTTNTRWTPNVNDRPWALPDSQAGQAYFWYIRPCKTTTVCGPDPVSLRRSAGHSFDKKSPEPRLVPSSDRENDITFAWDDYLTTNLATAFDETGEASYQSAGKYRIEVATDASFSSRSLVDSREVDQPTYTAFDRTYPDQELYWRVQAIDDYDNHLAWSQVRTLTKQSHGPGLSSPKRGAMTNGLESFRWGAQHFAKDYTVEVYAKGDETASPANLLFRATTAQAAYAWTSPVPKAEDYAWRVRRNDADGRPAMWSAWAHFGSGSSAPAQLDPAVNGYASSTDAVFSWTPVHRVATYRFERRGVGGGRIEERQDTSNTVWAPTRVIPDGAWEWRVTTLDASRKEIAQSPWRRFVVDGTRPTVVSKSPGAAAKARTTFKVKFSEPVRNVSHKTFQLVRRGTTRPVAADVSLSRDGKAATLRPNSTLEKRTAYTVRLTSGISDRAANALETTTWKVKVR